MLHAYTSPRCLLCGEEGTLTREHKIKRSVLSKKFGKQELYFGSEDDIIAGKAKKIQSTKSKHLKFKSPICEECNTTRTQPADRQFDSLMIELDKAHKAGTDPTQVFASERIAVGSKARLDLHRYFAKILCCFLADTDCPIPIRLSTFAIGRSVEDCLQIGIESNMHPFAEHVGLSFVSKSKEDLEPSHIISGISFGSVTVFFWFYFTSTEKAEFKRKYPRAYTRINDLIMEAKEKEKADDSLT